jgi:RNA polymerase sigma factor (sigma-70 family)
MGRVESEQSPVTLEQQIQLIAASDNPLDTLADVSDKNPFFLDIKTEDKLHAKLNNPQHRAEALTDLTWNTLRQVKNIVVAHRGLGVSDQELIGQGFLVTQEVIKDWGENKFQGKIRSIINNEGRRLLRTFIAREHGLILQDFPLISAYYKSRRELESSEYPPDSISLQNVVEAIQDTNPTLIPEVPEKGKSDGVIDNREARKRMVALEKRDDVIKKLGWIHQQVETREIELEHKGLAPEDSIEDEIDQVLLRDELETAMTSLTDRQRQVVVLHGGYYQKEHTLEEIGDVFGVTLERVRQIEAQAHRRLKHPSKQGLRSFTVNYKEPIIRKIDAEETKRLAIYQSQEKAEETEVQGLANYQDEPSVVVIESQPDTSNNASGTVPETEMPKEREARKEQLPTDQWTSEQFRKYRLGILNGKEHLRAIEDYPDMIQLHPSMHQVLDRIRLTRNRTRQQHPQFAIEGVNNQGVPIKQFVSLNIDYKNVTPGDMRLIHQDILQQHELTHMLGEFHTIQPGLVSWLVGRDINIDIGEYDGFKSEQLFNFLSYRDPRPLYTALAGRYSNLFAFISSDTICVEEPYNPLTMHEFYRNNTFGYGDRIDHERRRQIPDLINEDFASSCLVAGNHRIVLYRGEIDSELHKIPEVNIEKRKPRFDFP